MDCLARQPSEPSPVTDGSRPSKRNIAKHQEAIFVATGKTAAEFHLRALEPAAKALPGPDKTRK